MEEYFKQTHICEECKGINDNCERMIMDELHDTCGHYDRILEMHGGFPQYRDHIKYLLSSVEVFLNYEEKNELQQHKQEMSKLEQAIDGENID